MSRLVLALLLMAISGAAVAGGLPSWNSGATRDAIAAFVERLVEFAAMAVDGAPEQGWLVVDMQEDWSRIYPGQP